MDTKRNGYGFYRKKTPSRGWVIMRDSQLEYEEKEEKTEWEKMWSKAFHRPELTEKNGVATWFNRKACNGR